MIRKLINGRWEPPYTESELAVKDELFAQMCATQIPPGTGGTDRAQFSSRDINHHGLQDYPLWQQQMMVSQAKASGINVTGKVYRGGLADGRGAGDPAAWVSSVNDMITVAKKRNLNLSTHQGDKVLHKATPVAPTPDVPLSQNLINEYAQHYIEQDPNWKNKPQELVEMVVDTHGAPAHERAKKRKAEWKPNKDFKDE